MKLVRYSVAGLEMSGLADEAGVRSFASMGLSLDTIEEAIAGGDAALAAILGAKLGKADHALSGVKLLAPLKRPGKYLAIGLNYRKHLEEFGGADVKTPPHQVWFNKQNTCINDPGGLIDAGVSTELDYEVELGAVIGKTAKSVPADKALEYVFGYTIANDVTARDWQKHAPTWTVGKSFDTHGPIGPWIVTRDEIPDPQALDLKLFVNGALRQDSNTREMIHSVASQIAYLSTAFTLEPGDLLATGTPDGVGMAMKPPTWLQSGDVVRCEISGIGVLENKVR